MKIEIIRTNWRLPYIRRYNATEQDYDWQVVIQIPKHRIFIYPS